MYDSTTAADIPARAPMVAGYIDGAFAWSARDWARFVGVPRVTIAVHASTNDGDVLDVESGDATPAQAPAWIKHRQAAGLWRPTIYCPRSWVPDVHAACSGLVYDLWTADYTGHAHVTAGAVATQYANPPSSGGHYDLSLVTDDAWPYRVAPTPAPSPPATIETEEPDMPFVVKKNGDPTAWLVVSDGTRLVRMAMTDANDLGPRPAGYGPPVELVDADVDAIARVGS